MCWSHLLLEKLKRFAEGSLSHFYYTRWCPSSWGCCAATSMLLLGAQVAVEPKHSGVNKEGSRTHHTWTTSYDKLIFHISIHEQVVAAVLMKCKCSNIFFLWRISISNNFMLHKKKKLNSYLKDFLKKFKRIRSSESVQTLQNSYRYDQETWPQDLTMCPTHGVKNVDLTEESATVKFHRLIALW